MAWPCRSRNCRTPIEILRAGCANPRALVCLRHPSGCEESRSGALSDRTRSASSSRATQPRTFRRATIRNCSIQSVFVVSRVIFPSFTLILRAAPAVRARRRRRLRNRLSSSSSPFRTAPDLLPRCKTMRVFVEPFDLPRRMREIGEVPRLAAVRVDQPDLHGRGVGLRLGSRACADERRFSRRPETTSAARCCRCRASARSRADRRSGSKDRDSRCGRLCLCRRRISSSEPLAVRRNTVLADRFAVR